MAQREYVDFDLAIEDMGDGRFRARVLDSPSGQASIEFEMPFSDLEMENFLLKIGRPRAGVRRLESPETEAARAFGERLFEAVFDGDVGRQWIRSIDSAEHDSLGLRLRLRLSEAPSLTDIPWEYLYSPTNDDFVVLSSWTPMVRYISLDKGAPPLTVAPPLRMLAMVSSPTDYAPLDVEAEWARLDESLADIRDAGLIEIDRLEKATLRELQRALRRTDYHLFHFIGHGGFDEAAGDGLLLLEDDQGRAREISGRQLGTILDDARTIRLSVLNACEGARSSGTDPFAGVAQSLVARGIPAVVAMQFEITDRAAIIFAHEFYSAITDGMAVEAAVGEARRAIFGSKSDVEWGTAVLYMRAEDGRLFDMEAVPAASEAETVEMRAVAPTLEMERVEATMELETASADDPGGPVMAEAAVGEMIPEPEAELDSPTEAERSVVEEAKPMAGTEAVVAAASPVETEPAVQPEPQEPPPIIPAAPEFELPPAAQIEPMVETEPTAELEVEAEPVVFTGDEAEPTAPTQPDPATESAPALDPAAAAPAMPAVDDAPRSTDVVGLLRRNRRLVGAGAAVAAAVVLVAALATNGDNPSPGTTVAGGPTTVAPPIGGADLQVLDSAAVAAVAAPTLLIDGDLSDWTELAVAYELRHPVADALSASRLGTDSTGILWVGYDDDFLYVAVDVNDDVYSQTESGNQIWRGDALTINLVAANTGQPPARPDPQTFQLTVTPLAEPTGRPEAVLFVGNGERFDNNTTELAMDLAGVVDNDGDWRLEAQISWSVFGLDSPRPQFDAALFALFDNDGETSGGRSAQVAILTNRAGAFFQQPLTWGDLATE